MARGRNGSGFPGREWLVGAAVATAAALAARGNADLNAPPRYDGAGYAILAGSLADGHGYREVDRPDAPRHTHFPPGYPLALAALWRATGVKSVAAAYFLSLFCTAAAAAAAWRWLRSQYGPGVSGRLGLALAVNWTWGRAGGSIQSEPLFLLLEALAWLAATRAARRGGVGNGVATGLLLGACVLTRHVAAALVLAVVVHLLWSRRRASGLAAVVAATAAVTPWAAWLAAVGTTGQAGLLKGDGLPARIVSQAVFYGRRLPDQVTGPVVEVVTAFDRGGVPPVLGNVWAALASAVLLFGWSRTLRTPRRRLAGLSAFATLALLLVWPFTEAGRFLVPLVPCLLVGAVEGLAAAVATLGGSRPRVVASWLVLAASLPYPAYALATRRADAQRRADAGFDAACEWLRREGDRPGPVLARHPGDVYWRTGRLAVGLDGDGVEAVSRAVDRWRPAYLLADGDRYAHAPPSPIIPYAAGRPDRAREVWSRDDGRSMMKIYESVTPTGPPAGRGPAGTDGREARRGVGAPIPH